MSNNGTFQGLYVEDIKLALKASATSGVHTMLIGKPGTGKTTIAELMAEIMFGLDQKVFLEFEPTTPPEIVKGHYDVAALLGDPPENKLIVDGTINDPAAKVIICDELFRSMDPAFDPILHAINRFKKVGDLSPVVWATSNFSSNTERTEALRDRFGLWVWLKDEPLNWHDVVMNQMMGFGQVLDIGDGLPTWEDIKDIRAARPGNKAMKAIASVVVQLAQEAIKGFADKDGKITARFDMNPRRTDQWKDILFRMGYWVTGDADFAQVPAEATRCLQWAYPLTDAKQARQWAQICEAVSDPIQTAIDGLKLKAFQSFKKTLDSGMSAQAQAGQFGTQLAQASAELIELQRELGIGEDDRITQAISEIQKSYARVVRGEDPMKG